jgi:hypothetical protein
MYSESSPFVPETRFAVLPPTLTISQRSVRRTGIMVVLNSTAVVLSIPHCLFSLMPVPMHFDCGTYWRHNPHISDLHNTASKTGACFGTFKSGIWRRVVGRVVPDVSKVRREPLIQWQRHILIGLEYSQLPLWEPHLALHLQCYKTDTEVLWCLACVNSATTKLLE